LEGIKKSTLIGREGGKLVPPKGIERD